MQPKTANVKQHCCLSLYTRMATFVRCRCYLWWCAFFLLVAMMLFVVGHADAKADTRDGFRLCAAGNKLFLDDTGVVAVMRDDDVYLLNKDARPTISLRGVHGFLMEDGNAFVRLKNGKWHQYQRGERGFALKDIFDSMSLHSIERTASGAFLLRSYKYLSLLTKKKNVTEDGETAISREFSTKTVWTTLNTRTRQKTVETFEIAGLGASVFRMRGVEGVFYGKRDGNRLNILHHSGNALTHKYSLPYAPLEIGIDFTGWDRQVYSAGQTGILRGMGYGADFLYAPAIVLTPKRYQHIPGTDQTSFKAPIVNAAHTMVGYLTGNPAHPIIGLGPADALLQDISDMAAHAGWQVLSVAVRTDHRLAFVQFMTRSGDILLYTFSVSPDRAVIEHQHIQSCKSFYTVEDVRFSAAPDSAMGYVFKPNMTGTRDTGLLSGFAFIDIHGGPASRYWRTPTRVQEQLLRLGATIIAVNYRGSAGFDRHFVGVDAPYITVSDMVTDIDAVVTMAKKDFPDRKLVSISHSYGAYLTMLYFQAGLNKYLERNIFLAPYFGGTRGYAALSSVYGAHYTFHTRIRDDDLARANDPMPCLAPTVPSLVLHGRNDKKVPFSHVSEYVARCTDLAQNLLLHPLDTGHGVARELDTVILAIRNFLLP